MKRLFASLFLFASIGCHAQIPVTTHAVTLTWNASTGTPSEAGTITCTTSACTYVASRYTMLPTDTACPTVNTATPNYTPLNSANPTAQLSYVDSGAVGTQSCYTLQAVQLGVPSLPSNVVGPLSVPGNPTAPVLNNGTVAENKQPAMPVPSKEAAPILSAMIH